MLKKVIIGALLGGIVMFAWLGLAWTTWHLTVFRTMPDDRALMGELALRDMDSGIYYYPGMPKKTGDTTADKTTMEAWKDAMKSGPTITFMAYQKHGGNPDNPLNYVRGALYCLFSAALLSWMLCLAAPSLRGYFSRVLFCSAAGLFAAFIGPVITGNFFQFPQLHMFLELFDQVAGWTLAGLLLALVCRAPAAASTVVKPAA